MRRLAGLLCTLALWFPADVHGQYFGRNKVHYDRLDFRVLQTEHFDVHYYDEEAEAAQHAARMAERWYARLSALLDHTFASRQVLVLYASHPHFAQTNLTSGAPGEGVGGFTEHAKSRIAMPFAAGLGETDHVLGHEIAHAFQIDIARRAGHSAFTLPGWFIEGMAEYLSLGPVNPHTAMWLRDAAQHDALPSLDQLTDRRFFPYRYGHALWSYLATRFGDDLVGRLLRTKERRGVVARLEQVTGVDRDALTREWHASIRRGTARDDEGIAPGRTVVAARDRHTRLHVSPAISPDGSRLMFLSERDRVSLDVYMADADTGVVLKKIVRTAGDPHFDSLQYIHSAGAWDPSGRRFAFAALGSGEPILSIVDVGSGSRTDHVPATLGEIFNPSWSPDGSRLVFSALQGGLSDLFVFTPATGALERITDDAFADLHPAWSPDGRSIAFATDRFTSAIETLEFGALRIAVLDLASGAIRALSPDRSRVKQINPQWAPGGDHLYFVSDPGGISNVYRVRVADGGLTQVTAVRGGVSGITATSPAIAVAARSGTLAYSVYRNGRYEIRALDAAAMAGRAVAMPDGFVASGTLAPATNSPVSRMLADAASGLPSNAGFTRRAYDDRLRLEAISQPYLGATTGNTFGGALRASFGMSFGDMLKDRQLHSLVRVGTDVDDFAGQLAYVNRRHRLNWGMTVGHMPSRFFGARRSIERDGPLVTRETTSLRYTHQWAMVNASYGLNRSQRIEFGAGVRRTGFEWQTLTRVLDSVAREELRREAQELPAGRPIHVAEAHAALVHDTAVFGATGPILGQRYRFEVEPAFGGLRFADVRLDYRRYVMPLRPFTLAARIEHVGRYGSGGADPRLTPLVYGLQTLVRGYDLRSFAADECGAGATACSLIDELAGSRFALINLELRAPLFGLLSRSLDYGPVPIDLLAFVDGGFLWTGRRGHAVEFDRFRSAGAGARVNAGGIVFEIAAAKPFDRRGGWRTSFLLRPGF